MSDLPRHHGGSFAPPLTDKLLSSYAQLAAGAPPEIKDAMQTLLKCVCQWWDLPESSGKEGTEPHLSGKGTIVTLDSEIADALWDNIPWIHELQMLEKLFETITSAPLRNAAHHLLWFAKELELGREPITADKL